MAKKLICLSKQIALNRTKFCQSSQSSPTRVTVWKFCGIRPRISWRRRFWICFPAHKLGVGPALMEDPRYGFYYDVIAPRAIDRSRFARHRKENEAKWRNEISFIAAKKSPNPTLIRYFQRDGTNLLKCELIDEKVETEKASVYYIDGSPFV